MFGGICNSAGSGQFKRHYKCRLTWGKKLSKMKRLRFFVNYLVMVLFVASAIVSCNKDDEPEKIPNVPAEEQKEAEQKEAILTALNKNSDLSEFAAALNSLYLADVKAENLTVFVVNNEGMNQLTDDGINIKRHIVAGKFLKSSLTNGQKLVALDGAVLTIIIMGERVFVNGVVLGDEIQADNSVAYIVEEAISTSANTEQYSFSVHSCNEAWSPDNPVPYHDAAGATIRIWDESGHGLGSYTTGNNGKLTLTLIKGVYHYQVTKGDASNITKDGFIIAGIFTSLAEMDFSYQPQAVLGGLKFVDINGDGRINNDDKPADGYVLLRPSQVVYIAPADFAPSYKP